MSGLIHYLHERGHPLFVPPPPPPPPPHLLTHPCCAFSLVVERGLCPPAPLPPHLLTSAEPSHWWWSPGLAGKSSVSPESALSLTVTGFASSPTSSPALSSCCPHGTRPPDRDPGGRAENVRVTHTIDLFPT